MQTLRAKIFKRVRPKSLNERFITGETLLELCEAYTQAINTGSVPCIESAWTYVCKNESMRAQQQAIQFYRQQIAQLLSSCVEVPDYSELKQVHKAILAEAHNRFR